MGVRIHLIRHGCAVPPSPQGEGFSPLRQAFGLPPPLKGRLWGLAMTGLSFCKKQQPPGRCWSGGFAVHRRLFVVSQPGLDLGLCHALNVLFCVGRLGTAADVEEIEAFRSLIQGFLVASGIAKGADIFL